MSGRGAGKQFKKVLWKKLSGGLISAGISVVFCSLSPFAIASPAGDWLSRLTDPALLKNLELSGGYGRAGHNWYAYAGGTYAFGEGLDKPGFRLRATMGQGRYRYDRDDKTIFGQVAFAQALLGYQWQTGPLTLKTFAGVDYQRHMLSRADPENPIDGAKTGAKLQIESWLNIGTDAFASLDGSVSTVYRSYWGRARAGYRLLPSLSIGPEIGALGNSEFDQWTAGLFTRIERGKLSGELSGGWAQDFDGEGQAWGALSITRTY